MTRNYRPQYGEVQYIGKDAKIDVIIPTPDSIIQFSYHFILCKDRIIISKSGGPYPYMVRQRMTTNLQEAIKSFLKLDELKHI